MTNRVIFADYIARKELNAQGNPLALNMGQPNNDASIMTAIRDGQVHTTGAELAAYLHEINISAYPPRLPDPPTGLYLIPSDSTITIFFIAGFNGYSPIIYYEYSTDGTTFTPLSQIASPLTISGLTNGTVYTIWLRAVNIIGPSLISSSVTASPIPNSFSPATISGLKLWLDSQVMANVILTGSRVTGWNDSSSGANNFVSNAIGIINYAKPGINGRPSLNFETAVPTTTYLQNTLNLAPTNQLSLFIVLSQTSSGAGNSEIFYTRDNYTYFDLFNNTNTTGELSLNARSTTQRTTGSNIVNSTNNIISVALDTTTGSIFLNGSATSVASTSFTGTSLNASLRWAISGGAFKGYIGELVTYPSVLSTTDRQKVEGYLAWKWGLQGSLPAGHPYKLSPPVGVAAPAGPVLLYILGGNAIAYVYYTQVGTVTNYKYTTNDGTTYTLLSPEVITSPITVESLTNGVSTTVKLKGITESGDTAISNGISITPSNEALPAAWLLFDPNNTSSYSGSGPVNNIGSYGALSGTISGSVGYITGTNTANKVFNFAGGYISFGQLNFTSTFTITAWLYPTAKASINAILTNGFANVNTAGFKFGWNSWDTSDRRILFESGDGTSGNWQVPSTVVNTITMNSWQHVSVIFDRVNSVSIFLVNGIPVNVSGITTATNVSINQANFNIGAYLGGSYTMQAQLGLLKVFNSCLTASQVLADFNTTRSVFGV
jgi:hypothetical protein